MNDKERSEWVDKDEGLYGMWKFSGQSKRKWVKENRDLIDQVAGSVITGRQPAHYLKYG